MAMGAPPKELDASAVVPTLIASLNAWLGTKFLLGRGSLVTGDKLLCARCLSTAALSYENPSAATTGSTMVCFVIGQVQDVGVWFPAIVYVRELMELGMKTTTTMMMTSSQLTSVFVGWKLKLYLELLLLLFLLLLTLDRGALN